MSKILKRLPTTVKFYNGFWLNSMEVLYLKNWFYLGKIRANLVRYKV
jgi:hypothetical protein